MTEILDLLEEEDDTPSKKGKESDSIHMRYKIFHQECEGGDIKVLNFSEEGGYFPDYTANLIGNVENEK